MNLQTHPEPDLGSALATRVAADLREAIALRGKASLAVPGGTTPAPFLDALASADLDWSRIAVTLTDERCVPEDSDRSNARLVRQHLVSKVAARFVPLYGADNAEEAIRDILPLDALVLGMGEDMHTASLFPGTPGLADLLDPDGARLLAQVAPPGADEPRITLTMAALAPARNTYILIKGPGKRAALETALATQDRTKAPIRAILESDPVVFHGD